MPKSTPGLVTLLLVFSTGGVESDDQAGLHTYIGQPVHRRTYIWQDKKSMDIFRHFDVDRTGFIDKVPIYLGCASCSRFSVVCAQTESGVLRSQLAKLSGGEDPSKSSELDKALELMDTNSDGECREAVFCN